MASSPSPEQYAAAKELLIALISKQEIQFETQNPVQQAVILGKMFTALLREIARIPYPGEPGEVSIEIPWPQS